MCISAVIEDYAVCSTINTGMILRRVLNMPQVLFDNRITHIREKVLDFHYCLLQKSSEIVSKTLGEKYL